MKKKVALTCVCLLSILLVAGFVLTRGLSYMSNVELDGIDIATVGDGSHFGVFEYGRFTNSVTVYVENGSIVSISIDEDVFSASVTNISDEVMARVIDLQDTRIDAISGATATTHAYLKAIENALNNDERR